MTLVWYDFFSCYLVEFLRPAHANMRRTVGTNRDTVSDLQLRCTNGVPRWDGTKAAMAFHEVNGNFSRFLDEIRVTAESPKKSSP